MMNPGRIGIKIFRGDSEFQNYFFAVNWYENVYTLLSHLTEGLLCLVKHP